MRCTGKSVSHYTPFRKPQFRSNRMDDWSESTNSPISHRGSAGRSPPRAPSIPTSHGRRPAAPLRAPAPTGFHIQPQIACHASPLDDIHTPAQRNKLSGKAIAGPLGTGDRRPLRGLPGTPRTTGTAIPHRHLTPPTLRADPGPPSGPPARGAAPTGPHPHSATSSPQPTPAAPRAPPIGTARHCNGTPRHSPARTPLIHRGRSPRARAAPARAAATQHDLRKYHLPEHDRILV